MKSIFFFFGAVASAYTASLQADRGGRRSETFYQRNVMWVGGEYNVTAAGTYLVQQQYVEELLPLGGVSKRNPIVFFHGGLGSGAVWLDKPDGKPGWASYFLKQGYAVYLVDQWSVGRSTANYLAPTIGNTLPMEITSSAFTAPEVAKKYYQAQFHTQWPGSGAKGDPIFENFYSSFLPSAQGVNNQRIYGKSNCALLNKLPEKAILISHSNGGSNALLTVEQCPDKVRARVAIEDDQTPFASGNLATAGSNLTFPTRVYGLADVPLAYDPPVSSPSELTYTADGTNGFTDGLLSSYPCNVLNTPRKLVNQAKVPILFLTSEASVHAVYDQCEVKFLQAAGVSVDWRKLVDLGIRGNGHFMFLEKNSDDIADVVQKWLRRL